MLILLWILATISTLAAGYFTWRSDKRKAVPYPWLTAGLRAVLIFLAWLLIIAPAVTISHEETEKPIIVLIGDESASIPAAMKGDTLQFHKDFDDLANRLSSTHRVVRWGFGNRVTTDSFYRYREPGTDISAALNRAVTFFGQQNLGAVVIATDGRFNQGSHPLYADLPLKAPLYTIALGDTSLPRDIRIPQVYANRTVPINSQFEIRADVVGTNCKDYHGTIKLEENGATIQTIDLNSTDIRFDRSVSFTVSAATAGFHHYVLSVSPLAAESNLSNNRRDVFVEVVAEQEEVLIAAAAPHPDVNAIRESLLGLDRFKVTLQITPVIPDVSAYDVVILIGLPQQGQAPTFNKPVWYLLSRSTNNAALSQLQLPASMSMVSAVTHDVFPEADNSFSSFSLPQHLASVMDRMPPLSIGNGSATAGPASQVLLKQKGSNQPLWLMQQGMHPSALTLGEGLWRWRLYEYRYFHNHDVVDELIRQTVSFLASNANEKPWRVEMPKYNWSDAEVISLNAFLLNANNENINAPPAQITVTDSAGHKAQFTLEKNGNAYRLNLGIRPSGTYQYVAGVTYNGKAYSAAGSFSVSSTPTELMETGADYPLLYALSAKYGGHTFLSNQLKALEDSLTRNEHIKPVVSARTETRPLVDWKIYFFIMLIVAVTEWLLRKYWMAQ